jgi:aspartyl protease family protein
MGRGYLIFILVAGVFGCVMNTGMSRAPSGAGPAAEERFKQAAADDDGYRVKDASDEAEDGTVRLERNSDGHFYADVKINGTSIHALVDTGASGIALSREDARKAGLATSIGMDNVVGRGADGDVRGEYVMLDRVSLGHKEAEGMSAVVLNSGEQSLLGQSFLSKFDTVEIKGDRMVLR